MRALVPVLAAATLVYGAASAHETWLIPARFDAKPSEAVKLELWSGMDFPERGSSIQPDRLSKAAYRLGRADGKLNSLYAPAGGFGLTQSFAKSGVAVAWVELGPMEIDLTDDQVAEYLDEIGATEATRQLWAERKGRVPWKETYTKQAKTFVAVGGGRDRGWRKPVGMNLEIVPDDDPLAARVGGEMTVRMISGGAPLANAPVGLIVAGSKERIFRTTDAKGKATFTLPRAGEALLFAVHLRPTADGTRWDSDFTTTTFRVLAAK